MTSLSRDTAEEAAPGRSPVRVTPAPAKVPSASSLDPCCDLTKLRTQGIAAVLPSLSSGSLEPVLGGWLSFSRATAP